MNDTCAVDPAVIMETLARLGVDPGSLQRYAVLNGGISGSQVVRVWCDAGQLVLKTSVAPSTIVRERAEREVAFYRMLAPVLPLATPTMLASSTDGRGSALLLTSYDAVEPPERWPERQYIEVAMHLARLHARYWDATDVLGVYSWLRPFDGYAAALSDVIAAWRPLHDRLQALGHDHASLTRWLTNASRGLNALAERISEVPVTLCHGDCHSGNLLRDADGHLVWADWQEVGIGHGSRDVSFFVQRAMADGAAVPEEQMFRAYHEQVEAELGIEVSLHALQQAADASELYTRLLHWPAYLTSATDRHIAEHRLRIEDLLSRSILNG